MQNINRFSFMTSKWGLENAINTLSESSISDEKERESFISSILLNINDLLTMCETDTRLRTNKSIQYTPVLVRNDDGEPWRKRLFYEKVSHPDGSIGYACEATKEDNKHTDIILWKQCKLRNGGNLNSLKDIIGDISLNEGNIK